MVLDFGHFKVHFMSHVPVLNPVKMSINDENFSYLTLSLCYCDNHEQWSLGNRYVIIVNFGKDFASPVT